MRARSGETRGSLRGSPPLRTVVSCVTEPQPDPGAAGGTPEPAVYLFSCPTYCLRNLDTLGATTTWQYDWYGLRRKYSWWYDSAG